MEVHNNVLIIRHRGDCNGEDGERLAGQMVQAGEVLCRLCDKVIVYHDSSHLEKANEAYARAFGKAFTQMECEHEMGALIPKAMMRVLANFASTVSGNKMQIFKRQDDADTWLNAHRDPSCGPSVPTPVQEFLQTV